MAEFLKQKADYFWDKQMCRVAKRVGKLLVNTPITPNMITISNLLIVFPLTCLFSYLKIYWMIALLVNIYIFFDDLDGGLARLKELFSRYGAKLDVVADYLMYSVGYIFVAISFETNIKIIIFSILAQWLYAILTTVYIAPSIRKLSNFRKTKLKVYLWEECGLILGMDVSMQSLLITIFSWFSIRKHVFLICGILWCVDLIYRMLELWILNNTREQS